jgi:hypothetical protein
LQFFKTAKCSRSSVALDTAAPPLPVILDPDPGARRCLVLGLRARHHLVTNPEHAAIDLKHVTAILDLKSIIVDLATFDLDPTSLGLYLASEPLLDLKEICSLM